MMPLSVRQTTTSHYTEVWRFLMVEGTPLLPQSVDEQCSTELQMFLRNVRALICISSAPLRSVLFFSTAVYAKKKHRMSTLNFKVTVIDTCKRRYDCTLSRWAVKGKCICSSKGRIQLLTPCIFTVWGQLQN